MDHTCPDGRNKAPDADGECPPALNALKTGVVCCLPDEGLTFLRGNSHSGAGRQCFQRRRFESPKRRVERPFCEAH